MKWTGPGSANHFLHDEPVSGAEGLLGAHVNADYERQRRYRRARHHQAAGDHHQEERDALRVIVRRFRRSVDRC